MSLYSMQLLSEVSACALLEQRLWPEGLACPHCHSTGRIGQLRGKGSKPGVYKCYDCRKPFSLKLMTVFEGSHVTLHQWLQGLYILSAQTGRTPLAELQEALGVTPKTAVEIRRRIEKLLGRHDIFSSNAPGKPSPSSDQPMKRFERWLAQSGIDERRADAEFEKALMLVRQDWRMSSARNPTLRTAAAVEFSAIREP
jgi:transposase-like protein